MSQPSVFANTSDTKTIIRFVKEIERHPCLYDRKSPKYMDRELKRRTWIYIAKKANCTVAECKDKWTKIRTAYVRTLRPTYVGGVCTFSRPYYLASHLKFIPPVKKNGACKGGCPQKSDIKQDETNEIDTNIEEEESAESEDNMESDDEKTSQHQVFLDETNNSVDLDDDDIRDYDNMVIETKNIDKNDEGNKTKVKENINSNETNCENTVKTDMRMFCGESFENNPRKMFLFSLLPDIEDLNEQQMRSFRKEVIKLIEHVNFNY